jgi:serine protease inhibitor ecotin
VPFFQAGISGLVAIVYGDNFNSTGGALEFKVGGGFDYYIIPKVAVGMQTTFAFGPGFSSSNNTTRVGFSGFWDLVAGVRIVL